MIDETVMLHPLRQTRRLEMSEHKALSAFEQAAIQVEVIELKQRLKMATKTIKSLNKQITRLEDVLFSSMTAGNGDRK